MASGCHPHRWHLLWGLTSHSVGRIRSGQTALVPARASTFEPESESAHETFAGAAAAAALVLGGGAIAYADNLWVVDSLEARVTSVELGELQCGDPGTAEIQLAVRRTGNEDNPQTFGSGESISFTATPIGSTEFEVVAPAPITLPSNWGTIGNTKLSDTATAVVTVPTDAEGGPFNGEIEFEATGQTVSRGPLTLIEKVSVSWSVGECSQPDTVPPVVEFDADGPYSCPTTPLLLGSAAEVHWTAYDPEPSSGLTEDSPTSGVLTLDTSSVGVHEESVEAGAVKDKAGNESEEVVCKYSVIYDFDGFFRPVDMNGVVNKVKAGSAVPIKFSLAGDQGLDVIAAGSPTLKFTPCSTGAAVDQIEETVTAGGSSLSYDPVADQYVYVWKTQKDWAGKCGTFTLTLDDETSHSALFSFTK